MAQFQLPKTHDLGDPVPVSSYDGVFNALTDPWLPATELDGSVRWLALADVLRCSNTIASVGDGMPPLERDAVTRLIIAVASLGLSALPAAALEEGIDRGEYPASAADALLSDWEHYFWLRHPTHPFCQDWERDSDVTAYPGKTDAGLPAPTDLDLHVPGTSSSHWALRPAGHTQAPSPAARLMLLVAQAWWYTLNGNRSDAFGNKMTYGAPGNAAIRTLSLYEHSDEHFGKTLLANIPQSWVARKQVPAFLAQDVTHTPSTEELALDVRHLWRTTFAANRPLLYWDTSGEAPEAVTFTLGPTHYPTPLIAPGTSPAEAERASLRAMHAEDPALLYVTIQKRNGTEERKLARVPETSLRSTLGMIEWYRGNLGASLQDWRAVPRLLTPKGREWSFALCSFIQDGKGSILYADYAVMPHQVMLAPDRAPSGFGPGVLPDIARTLLGRIGRALFLGTDGHTHTSKSKNSYKYPLSGQAAAVFYARIEPRLFECLAMTDLDRFDAHAEAKAMRRIGSQVVSDLLAPTRRNPAAMAQTMKAEDCYRRESGWVLLERFDPEEAQRLKSKSKSPEKEKVR